MWERHEAVLDPLALGRLEVQCLRRGGAPIAPDCDLECFVADELVERRDDLRRAYPDLQVVA